MRVALPAAVRDRCSCSSTTAGRRRRLGAPHRRGARARLLRRRAPGGLPRSCRCRRAALDIAPADAARNTEKLRALAPVPYAPDRAGVLPPIAAISRANPEAEIVWIADGLELGGAGAFARSLAGLAKDHDATVLTDKTQPLGARRRRQSRRRACRRACCARMREAAPEGVRARARRQGPDDRRGAVRFRRRARRDRRKFDLPIELRNEVASVEIADERSAGAVALLDERWKRRRVAHRVGRQRRCRAAAAGADLLSSPRARAFRRHPRMRATARADPIVALIARKAGGAGARRYGRRAGAGA